MELPPDPVAATMGVRDDNSKAVFILSELLLSSSLVIKLTSCTIIGQRYGA